MKKSNIGRVASTPVMTYTSRFAGRLASVEVWLNQSLNFTRFTTTSQLMPRVFGELKSTSSTKVTDLLFSSSAVSDDLNSLFPRTDSLARESVRGNSEFKSSLTALLEKSSAVTFVDEVDFNSPNTRGINWDVVVKRVKFSDWFSQTSTEANRPANRDVYVITGVDATRPMFDFFIELDDAGGVQKLAAALEHLAQQRTLRAITNPTSNLEGGLKIDLIRVAGTFVDGKLKIEKEEATNPPIDSQEYSFDQGELLRLEIENQSNSDLYVTLFDISTDGSIQILYPPTGAAISLPKGTKVKPDALIFKLGGPAVLETYKLIAATEKKGPSDYAFLQQSAVTRSSGTMSLATVPEWTTTQINLL